MTWELGLAVPGDLSVVSHADTPLAEYSVSPLTAVHMPLAELGAAGVDALVDRIGSGPGSDLEIDAEPRLSSARRRARRAGIVRRTD